MKALILAAGKGSRLGSVTEHTPKSMLRLNDHDTLLSYNLKNIAALGIKSVILVTGFEQEQCHTYAAAQCQALDLDLTVVYNPFWASCNVLGSMYMALDRLDDDFIFLHADTLLEKEAIGKLMDSPNECVLSVDGKSCAEEEMKVVITDDHISTISKEINPEIAHGEFVGIAKFNLSMVDYFRSTATKLFSQGKVNEYMEAVLQHAIEHGDKKISYVDTSDYKSIEVDFEEDLEQARSLFA